MATKTNQAVSNAVQNTPEKANGQTLGEMISNPDKSDVKFSYEKAKKAYDLKWGEGGLDEAEARVGELKGKIGEQVYDIFRRAMSHCEGLPNVVAAARSYGMALCDRAEDFIIKYDTKLNNNERKLPISTLIPLWPKYKSAIALGMEKGMNPLELMEGTPAGAEAYRWSTAAEYKTAVDKLGSTGGGNQTGQGGDQGGQNKGAGVTALKAVVSDLSEKMGPAVRTLLEGIRRLDHEEQDIFAQEVLNLGGKVIAYADSDERKAKLASKAEATKAAPVTGQIVEDGNGNVTGTTRSDEPVSQEAVAALQTAIDGGKPKAEETPKATGRRTRAA